MNTLEQNRCLAYNLANVVAYEDLSEIAGGGIGTQITTTINVTHKYGQFDGGIDVQID